MDIEGYSVLLRLRNMNGREKKKRHSVSVEVELREQVILKDNLSVFFSHNLMLNSEVI
jgi:hypothetical protein